MRVLSSPSGAAKEDKFVEREPHSQAFPFKRMTSKCYGGDGHLDRWRDLSVKVLF